MKSILFNNYLPKRWISKQRTESEFFVKNFVEDCFRFVFEKSRLQVFIACCKVMRRARKSCIVSILRRWATLLKHSKTVKLILKYYYLPILNVSTNFACKQGVIGFFSKTMYNFCKWTINFKTLFKQLKKKQISEKFLDKNS